MWQERAAGTSLSRQLAHLSVLHVALLAGGGLGDGAVPRRLQRARRAGRPSAAPGPVHVAAAEGVGGVQRGRLHHQPDDVRPRRHHVLPGRPQEAHRRQHSRARVHHAHRAAEGPRGDAHRQDLRQVRSRCLGDPCTARGRQQTAPSDFCLGFLLICFLPWQSRHA